MRDDQRRVLFFVVAQTTYTHWEDLPDLRTDVLALRTALGVPESGYELHAESLFGGGTRAEVERALDALVGDIGERDCVVFYWTGHGAGDVDHYLITRESPLRPVTSLKAVRADVLGEVLAKSKAEKIVVLVDTCYSSQGARAIAEQVGAILSRRTYASGQTPFFAVIPSAHSAERAQAGVFCRILRDILVGTTPTLRSWTDRDRLIGVGALRDALLDGMRAAMGDGWQPPLPVLDGWGERFLPNPRYRPAPPLDVETSRRRLMVPDALQVAVGGIEAGEGGRYFTPRRVMQEVATWLAQPHPGLAVVTGSPGAGKSAVLGHVAVRAAVGDGSAAAPITAVVYARGQTASQVAAELDRHHATSGTTRPVLIIDAVDEAAEPHAIAALAVDLVASRAARVLVGARRSLDGRLLPTRAAPDALLRRAFGDDATIVDLDRDPDTASDIAAYVRRRLEDSPHRQSPTLVETTARRVADAAGGSFLYARVVSRTLQSAERLDGPLPANQLDAFETDLRARFPGRLPLIEAALGGLAWSRGSGVSRDAWPALANALTGGDAPVDDRDIAWILDRVGWHILETDEGDQTVYRLIHHAFAEYFRARVGDSVAIERRIARQLSSGYQDERWLNADPYRVRHLAAHAAAGGVLDEFVTQAGFLAVADPAFLLPVLDAAQSDDARRYANVYRRAQALSPAMRIEDRPAILRLAAHQQDSALAEPLRPRLAPSWQSRWAHWRASVPSTTLALIDDSIEATTLTTDPDGRALLVYATGAVLVGVDLATATQAAWRVTLGDSEVRVLEADRLDNEAFVVGGDAAGLIGVLRLSDMSMVSAQAHAGSVRGVAFVTDGSRRLVGTCGDDGDVALWTLPDLAPVSRARGVMQPTGIAATAVGGSPALLVTGDTHRKASLPPAAMWAVPALTRMARYTVPTLIDELLVITLGRHRVALGSRYGELVAWDLDSGERLPVANQGSDTSSIGTFMPIAADAAHATVASNYGGGQFHLLEMALRDGRPVIGITPWIETGGGAWHGPVALWGRPHLVSVGREIRVWAVSDLVRAVAAAPREAHLRRQWQQSYGVLAIASADDRIWFGVDSGALLAADRHTGAIVQRLELPGGRPVGLWVGTIDQDLCLLVGAYEGILHCLDAQTGAARRPAIDIGGPISALAVARYPVADHLAITTRSEIDGRHEYHVRLWKLPAFIEVDTRHAERDAMLRRFGADIHWQLAVPNYEREKPLNAVACLASREGPLVAAGGDPMQVAVWDVRRLDLAVMCAIPHRGSTIPNVTSLTELVAARDLMLAAGTDAGTVVVWEVALGRELWTRHAHSGATHVAAIWWNGAVALASGGQDGVLRIWAPDGAERQQIRIGAAIWALARVADDGVAVGCNLGLLVLDSGRAR